MAAVLGPARLIGYRASASAAGVELAGIDEDDHEDDG